VTRAAPCLRYDGDLFAKQLTTIIQFYADSNSPSPGSRIPPITLHPQLPTLNALRDPSGPLFSMIPHAIRAWRFVATLIADVRLLNVGDGKAVFSVSRSRLPPMPAQNLNHLYSLKLHEVRKIIRLQSHSPQWTFYNASPA
jgi:hypothetical protein